MSEIKFESVEVGEAICPVCKAGNLKTYGAIKSKDYYYSTEEVSDSFIKCALCESIYYANTEVYGYLDGGKQEEHEAFTRHYFLIGCGINLGIELVSSIRNCKSMLEVGCGAGFTLDYWCNYKGNSGVGLEAAYYGAVGRKYLGIDIKDNYLNSKDAPLGKFDLVYSSEVIEHVAQPRDFLLAIKNNLASNGTLILTTPAANYINEEGDASLMLAAMSPGFHYFLLSEKGMRNLLESSGFKSIDIRIKNERMVVFAKVNDPIDFSNEVDAKQEYINYLYYLSKNPNQIVVESALIRLFEELVNRGDFEKAKPVLADLLSLIKKEYCLDLELLISSIQDGGNKELMKDYLYELPPYMSVLLYYMGIYFSRNSCDLINKLVCFALALQISQSMLISNPQFAQKAESMIKPARAEFSKALFDNASFFLSESEFMIYSEFRENYVKMQERADSYRHQLDMMLQSASWKITRPLRWFKDLL